MVKNYLIKFLLICFIAVSGFNHSVSATDSLSDLYIKITDATTAVKEDNQQRAIQLLDEIRQQFLKEPHADSQAGLQVQQTLNSSQSKITQEHLVKLSSALLKFEKEQNPVDIEVEKRKLKDKLEPSLISLEQAITDKNLTQIKNNYKKFNMLWTSNESIVRDTSATHYGKIETSIAFLRSTIEAEPTEFKSILNNYQQLTEALNQFMSGEQATTSLKQYTLTEGIQLLQEGYDAFQQQDSASGQAKIKKFIEIWPIIEGDVRTRNSQLYVKVENDLPIIMIKGQQHYYQQQLQQLIRDLLNINEQAHYNFIDAMLILLREGIEALLIVLALVGTLKAAKQSKGLMWVYGGATLGVFVSIIVAMTLHYLFPTIASGQQREVLEGIVGIIAVIMMVIIGVWLHSKSSVQSWNRFMDKHMNRVLSTGSFMSMFLLSFLAIFREGAETILFYVGILPKITLSSLLIGISLACLLLMVIAYIMTRATLKFAPYKLFFILTWFIYLLAFKMLGVSVHALQFNGILPTHILTIMPTLEWVGIYPTIETLGSQFLFILVVMRVVFRQAK